MQIPTDPISAAIWGINLLVEVLSIPDAYARLQSGIAARAQAAGRDVTPEEEALLDGMLEASKMVRDGNATDGADAQ